MERRMYGRVRERHEVKKRLTLVEWLGDEATQKLGKRRLSALTKIWANASHQLKRGRILSRKDVFCKS